MSTPPDTLPFSQASENNKRPIHAVLVRHLPDRGEVLEIGGGTGQHAVFFAQGFPDLRWQATDLPQGLATLRLRIEAAALPNLPPPIALDVNDDPWPTLPCDCVFSANTLHIMSSSSAVKFMRGSGACLPDGGLLLVYGPFRYGGQFTTESNARFDAWLRARDPASGIRDFEWVDGLAREAGLTLLEDNAMPANNQLLVWRKSVRP